MSSTIITIAKKFLRRILKVDSEFLTFIVRVKSGSKTTTKNFYRKKTDKVYKSTPTNSKTHQNFVEVTKFFLREHLMYTPKYPQLDSLNDRTLENLPFSNLAIIWTKIQRWKVLETVTISLLTASVNNGRKPENGILT